MDENAGESNARNRIVTGKRLWSLGILHEADLTIFGAYCRAVDKLSMIRDELRTQEKRTDRGARSYVLQTMSGVIKNNPLLESENREMKMILKLGAKIGLNPVSRAKLGLGREPGDPREDDPTKAIFEAPNVVPIGRNQLR